MGFKNTAKGVAVAAKIACSVASSVASAGHQGITTQYSNYGHYAQSAYTSNVMNGSNAASRFGNQVTTSGKK